MAEPPAKRPKVGDENDSMERTVVLKSYGANVASLPYTDFNAVYPVKDDDLRWGKLHLSGERGSATNLCLDSFNFSMPQVCLRLLVNWIRNRDAKRAMHFALVRYKPKPKNGEVDQEWVNLVCHFLAYCVLHSELIHSVHDSFMDCLIDYVRIKRHENLDEVFKHCIVGSPKPFDITAMFANLFLHHKDGFVSERIHSENFRLEVQSIALKWIDEAWKAKDLTIIPQDIMAEDFQDYCRYHAHGHKLCYRQHLN